MDLIIDVMSFFLPAAILVFSIYTLIDTRRKYYKDSLKKRAKRRNEFERKKKGL